MRLSRGTVLALVIAGLVAPGCKRRAPQPSSSAAASAAPTPQPVAPRCQESVPGAVFTLGDVGPRSPAEADGSVDEPDLPFAVELGRAVTHGEHFYVSALRAKGAGTTAVVAELPSSGRGGRFVELGKTHGDVEPPRLASYGGALIAAVPDSDAGGGVLRMARLSTGATLGVTWGGEVSEGRDDSKVFDVALSKQRGVVVWDQLDRKKDRSVISIASFAAEQIGSISPARIVSGAEEDAEAPQLSTRPGGFWLAWLGRALEKRDARATPMPSADIPLIAFGARRLMLVPLDENGARTGEPVSINPVPSHVLVYDLVGLSDGSALVAWRDDPTSPGAEGRAVQFARIASGGEITRSTLQDESVGAGVPSLILDAAAQKKASPLWLSLGSVTDETKLAAISPTGALVDRLDSEPTLRSAEPLAARAGLLFIGRPKGLAVELSVLRCAVGAPAAAAPTPGLD